MEALKVKCDILLIFVTCTSQYRDLYEHFNLAVFAKFPNR